MIRSILFATFTLLLAHSVHAKQVAKEYIYFVDQTGKSALLYVSGRSDRNRTTWITPKGQSAEEVLDQLTYLFPQDYRIDRLPGRNYERIIINSGAVASMTWAGFDPPAPKIASDGTYRWTNFRGKEHAGHYGFWSHPDGYRRLAFVFVLPNNFEFVEYSANRRGKWNRKQNIISFFADNVNDVVVEVSYRPKYHSTYAALTSALGDREGIEIEERGEDMQVRFLGEILFPSGSADLSSGGRDLLRDVAQALRGEDDIQLSIEGHTDNVPIRGRLAKLYETNWELSAARSLSVLRFLIDAGLAAEDMRAIAYGAQQPRASNATAEGRAKNRRIELSVAKY